MPSCFVSRDRWPRLGQDIACTEKKSLWIRSGVLTTRELEEVRSQQASRYKSQPLHTQSRHRPFRMRSLVFDFRSGIALTRTNTP
jgi:hypothetical protein